MNKYNVTIEQANLIFSHVRKSFKKINNAKEQINESDIVARKCVSHLVDLLNEDDLIDCANAQLETMSYFAHKNENVEFFSLLKNESKSIEEKIFTYNDIVVKNSRESLNKFVRKLRLLVK
jgi:predicted aconitase